MNKLGNELFFDDVYWKFELANKELNEDSCKKFNLNYEELSNFLLKLIERYEDLKEGNLYGNLLLEDYSLYAGAGWGHMTCLFVSEDESYAVIAAYGGIVKKRKEDGKIVEYFDPKHYESCYIFDKEELYEYRKYNESWSVDIYM